MITNPEIVKKFEDNFIKKERLSYQQSLDIVESLWAEGVALGILPPKEHSSGIDIDIKIASILNSCSEKSCQK